MEKTKKICYNLDQQTNRSLVCARLKGLNMEYTPIEKNVLSMMQRTDFKNLSKNDVISFASKLGGLRPEVAKERYGNNRHTWRRA